MLSRLSVENYALIDKLDLELGPALNIITGETGAGKSILLGALGLILGNRADVAALKDPAKNCIIEGFFNIGEYRLEKWFEENDLDYDPAMFIRRVITPAGKSRAYVNDLPVQLTTLKELSSRLVDIHSQHQSLMLGSEEFRTGIIDGVATDKTALPKYRSAYKAYADSRRKLSAIREQIRQAEAEQDYLSHQYEQISALGLCMGEEAELDAEQKELANAESILIAIAGSEERFTDDQTGVIANLKASGTMLRQISDVYPRGGDLAERIRESLAEIKDIGAELSAEADRIDVSPQRLAHVEERLAAIHTLLRRHNLESGDELVDLREQMEAKLAGITGGCEAVAELEKETERLRGTAMEAAVKLTASRTKAAEDLGNGVMKILERLGMPSAQFTGSITPLEELSPDGADEITFLFSANRDMPARPIEKIASGGEVSRVMLALKSLVASRTHLPTIVFDEIDTGVSGRIADAMGDIIAELADNLQVINITHLPQIAAKGGNHFLVYKNEEKGNTSTGIRLLQSTERVEEIAKMLSGSKVTEAALRQAEALLGKSHRL